MDASKLMRVGRAAQECGVPPQTLDDAVRAGRVPSHPTSCGLPLVRLADVRRWDKRRQVGAGRPRKG
jgi:hypothetical protein